MAIICAAHEALELLHEGSKAGSPSIASFILARLSSKVKYACRSSHNCLNGVTTFWDAAYLRRAGDVTP